MSELRETLSLLEKDKTLTEALASLKDTAFYVATALSTEANADELAIKTDEFSVALARLVELHPELTAVLPDNHRQAALRIVEALILPN